MRIFVIIPGFNEEKYLKKVLSKVKKHSTHVIYVDDGSIDNSVQVARAFTRHVLIHELNLGKGAALKTGSEYAFSHLKADAVVFMDADDQHDPKELPRFFRALQRYHAVFGVRRMEANMPLFRFLGNKAASILLNMLFGSYIPDIPSGFKGITKSCFKRISWDSKGYEVETEIAARIAKNRIQYKVVQIESIYHDRDKGMTLLDGLSICSSLLQWKLRI